MVTQTHLPGQFSFRRQIAKQWTEFSETELDDISNNASRLAEALQNKYGLSAKEAERQVRSFACRAWNEHRQAEWLAS